MKNLFHVLCWNIKSYNPKNNTKFKVIESYPSGVIPKKKTTKNELWPQ